jgi:cytochrome c6
MIVKGDAMKKIVMTASIVLCLSYLGTAAFAQTADTKNTGEAKYKAHCAVCHPDGGNIINAKKTLHKKDRDANNVKTEADIVKLVRKPGPGMNAFDAKTISDKDADEIAKYIIKTFK